MAQAFHATANDKGDIFVKALIFNIQRFSLHDGKGIRTTVFFKGCNLRCNWCANPESLSLEPELMQGKPVGKYYTVEELMAEILKDKPFYDKSNGGVTLSGGEPLLQADFVSALCDALHASGINVAIETAASVPKAIFAKILKKCDHAFIDLKHWDVNKHLEGTGTDNRQILANIRYALAHKLPVTLRIPIIPGYNDSRADALAFSELLKTLGASDVQLLPFHQLGESKYTRLGMPYEYSGIPQLGEESLEEYSRILSDAGIKIQIGG